MEETTPRRKQAVQTRVRMSSTSAIPSADSHEHGGAQKSSDPGKHTWRPPLASLAVNAPIPDHTRELKKRMSINASAVDSPIAVKPTAVEGALCSASNASPATMLCGCALWDLYRKCRVNLLPRA